MAKKEKKKKNKWVLRRHRIVQGIAVWVLRPFVKRKYGIDIQPFKEQGNRQYLVLSNHQTAFDQFFIGLAFKGPVYYVASEDLFSKGFVSKLLQWAVAPIPIKKQSTDPRAVLNCMRVKKEGGNIALFPEGNRTFSGRTEYIKPSVAGLARALKLPIAFYRIEGGYGVQPRWSDVVRKGKMRGYVSEVMEVEAYKDLTEEELYRCICEKLYVDDTQGNKTYEHKESAQYIERAYYVCPTCGLSTFRSQKDIITCTQCGLQVKYMPDLSLQSKGEFPFKNTREWYDYQTQFVSSLDLEAYKGERLYKDEVQVFDVQLYKSKRLRSPKAILSLYGDKLEIQTDKETLTLDFENVSVVTVLGRNKLNVYYKDQVFQCKGEPQFNAVKYVQIFNHWKNVNKGEADGKFLGL